MMTEADDLTPADAGERLDALAERLGLTMEASFVPWSEARHRLQELDFGGGLPRLSLNWRVTINRNGKPILTTPYTAGIGLSPAGKRAGMSVARPTGAQRAEMFTEAETGKEAQRAGWNGREWVAHPKHGKPLLPNFRDVLACLASDSDALDYPTYEEWASCLGYDPDSRTGERVYRASLENALKLRAGLGEDGLAALIEAANGY